MVDTHGLPSVFFTHSNVEQVLANSDISSTPARRAKRNKIRARRYGIHPVILRHGCHNITEFHDVVGQ